MKKVFDLKGEINAKTGKEYKEQIVALFNEADILILSLKEVVYLNSSGLREMIDLLKQSNSIKKEIRLCDMSKDIRYMFSFTGLEKVFKIYDTEKEAML